MIKDDGFLSMVTHRRSEDEQLLFIKGDSYRVTAIIITVF